jgi:hypothetical protein
MILSWEEYQWTATFTTFTSAFFNGSFDPGSVAIASAW